MNSSAVPAGTECIHGLDVAMCDVCSPRAVPQRRAASRPAARRPKAPAAARTRPGVRVAEAKTRVYLVVARERLPEVLIALPDQDWRSELGSATDPFRWPDVETVERPSDLVVLVAGASDPADLLLVAAANEPARSAVREILDAADVEVRLVLQPAWWA